MPRWLLLLLGLCVVTRTATPTAASTSNTAAHLYTSLVFEGGGVKGAVYSGAVIGLAEAGALDGVKNFAGTSAGSTVASLLAAGFTPCEIARQTLEVSFSDLVEFPLFPRLKAALLGSGTLNLMSHLKRRKGFFYGHQLENTIDMILAKKFCARSLSIRMDDISMSEMQLPDADAVAGRSKDSNATSTARRCVGFRRLTFRDLYEATGKELALTGFDITNGTLVYFSRKTEPDMPVSKAVRISSSIPIVFEPMEWRGHLYMDGGVLRRVPVDAFDMDASMLALKIMTDYQPIHPSDLEDLTVKTFVQQLVKAIVKQTQDVDLLQRAKAAGVQIVDFSGLQAVKSVSGLNFEMSEVVKVRMFLAGYWQMREHLAAQGVVAGPRPSLPCTVLQASAAGEVNQDCRDRHHCPWAQEMMATAVAADAAADAARRGATSLAGGLVPGPRTLLLLGMIVGLVGLTSMCTLCRNGIHLIALQNYSGIRTQRCDHCGRLWLPAQLPAVQVPEMSDAQVARALDARGIAVVRTAATAAAMVADGSGNDDSRRRRGSSLCAAPTYAHRLLQRSVYVENISLRRPWTLFAQSKMAPRVCCHDLPINLNLMMALFFSWTVYLAWVIGRVSEGERLPWPVEAWQS